MPVHLLSCRNELHQIQSLLRRFAHLFPGPLYPAAAPLPATQVLLLDMQQAHPLAALAVMQAERGGSSMYRIEPSGVPAGPLPHTKTCITLCPLLVVP